VSSIGSAFRRRGRVRHGGIVLNTTVSAARTMLRLLVGFALLPLLLHGIGATRTGLFLFATTLTGYFTAVDISIGSSVTRYVAEHRARDQASELAATVRGSLLLLLGVGVLAGGALAIVGLCAATTLFGEPVLRSTAEATILVAAATAVVYWPSRIGVAALNGLERYDQTAEIQIVTAVILLPVLGVMASAHASVALLTAVFGIIAVSEGILSAALAWRPLGVGRGWLSGQWLRGHHMRGVLRFGGAAFVIGISDTLINAFDRTIVGAVVGAAAIVGYDIAQRPASAIKTIAGLSGLALISPVARLSATGQDHKVRELMLMASFVSIVVTMPLGILVMVLAHPFIAAWLGSRYSRYAPYLDVFVFFYMLNSTATALSSALYGVGRLGVYARIVLVVSVISLPLSLGLTYAWGTIGVIWGTVIPSTPAIAFLIAHALDVLTIPVRSFVHVVLFPSLAPLVAWAALVLLADRALSPHGYPELIGFSGVALIVCWGAFAPTLRRRLRHARAVIA
jgi:O-antigen/teichoic acid export membrane protein